MPDNSTREPWDSMKWAEWKGKVGAKLETIERNQDTIFDLIGTLRDQVGVIKGKAAAWGATAGLVVALILAVIMYASRPKEKADDKAAVKKATVLVDVKQRPRR